MIQSTMAIVICATMIAEPKISPTSQQELAKRFPLLARLVIPKDRVPKGCRFPSNPFSPFGIKGNQVIVRNPDKTLLLNDLAAEMLAAHVQALFFSVAHEESEVGIFAWTFDSKKNAKKMHYLTRKNFRDRFDMWLEDKTVICVWRDKGTTDQCLGFFKAHVEKQLAEHRKQESETR